MENLLIEQVGKSVSLFGPNHLLNLLKITNLLVYLTLLVYLAPESSAISPLKSLDILPNYVNGFATVHSTAWQGKWVGKVKKI